jgi:hypothetical protein
MIIMLNSFFPSMLLPLSTYDYRSRGRNLSTRVCRSSYWAHKDPRTTQLFFSTQPPPALVSLLHSPNDSIHSSCLMRAGEPWPPWVGRDAAEGQVEQRRDPVLLQQRV